MCAPGCHDAAHMYTPPLGILSLLGLRVVYVDELGADAILINGRGIVLIDSALGPTGMALVADQALTAATASLVA